MAKTVTTYLIDDEPTGTQYAILDDKNCKMFVIPRSNIKCLKDRKELNKPALYILLGEEMYISFGDDKNTKPQAYIGQTVNFKDRIQSHNNDKKKKNWDKALVFISNSQEADLTSSDVQYLEHNAIREAKNVNTFDLPENEQTPKEPKIPEHRKNTMDKFFEDVKFLVSFFGCNIFKGTAQAKINEKLFYLKNNRDCDAVGFYNSEGFTVLKDSKIAKETIPSFRDKEKRDIWLKDFTKMENGEIVLTSNYTFSDVSPAANFCSGGNDNGWLVWKDKEGNTLDAVYRIDEL